MALINCPECSKEISDKVKACPHCGYPFDEREENIPQQVEVTSVKLINNRIDKKVLFRSIVAIVVCIIGVVGVQMNNAKTYVDNLNLVKESMLLGANEAEKLCNLTGDVWRNTIYKESDSSTDRYCIKPTKYDKSKSYYGDNDYESDFNTALAKLFADLSTKDKIDSIRDNQIFTQELMKELNSPTKEFTKIYDIVSELYSCYQGLTDLAINPTGNLTSFLQSKGDKVEKFLEYYNKLEMQIPSNK